MIRKSGDHFVPATGEETCCGFGGIYSANFPSISAFGVYLSRGLKLNLVLAIMDRVLLSLGFKRKRKKVFHGNLILGMVIAPRKAKRSYQ